MARRVTEKLDRQGPMFLVDLSHSGIGIDAATIKLAKLCDDESISGFFLVADGSIREIKNSQRIAPAPRPGFLWQSDCTTHRGVFWELRAVRADGTVEALKKKDAGLGS